MAAKKAGKWYRGVLEAAERFMARWHEDGNIDNAAPSIPYGWRPGELVGEEEQS